MRDPEERRRREVDLGGWLVFLAPVVSVALVLALVFGPRCEGAAPPPAPVAASPPGADGSPP
jgi:hypothetical protein